MTRQTLIVSLALLGACAAHQPVSPADPVPAAPPPVALEDGHMDRAEHAETVNAVAQSLERLAELEILHVGALVVDAPEASMNCYGPCEDDPDDQAFMQEHARQAARLAALVEAAEGAAAYAPAADPENVGAAVEALRALEIVEIHGPQTGNCYGPCPGDDATAGVIERLADTAAGL